MENNREEKFCLKAEVCYRKQVMLYGGERPSMQSFSNLFYTDQEFNDPYFLVQANAYVLNEMLKDPCRIEGKKDCSDPHCPPPCEPCCEPCCDPCCDSCCDSCCDAYCEPFFYLFLDVCLAGDVKLIRLACGEIQAKPCAESKPCDHCPEDDPRKIFNEMDFPNELFLPQK